MKLFLITVITLFQFLPEERGHYYGAHGLPQGASTDPCESSPCGKGAECKAMGSIAICVCPNDGKGDPFVNCMQQGSEESLMNMKESSASADPDSRNQFVASFDVGSVHMPNAKPTPISTAKPMMSSTTTPSSTPRPTSNNPSPNKIITGSPTRSTTTKNPFVHVFETSTFRPPAIQGSSISTQDQGHGGSYDLYSHNKNQNRDRNHPESHRIPILENNRNEYGQHVYPPRPISGSTSTPGFSSYHGSGSSAGTTYDIFNEKSVGPIADYGVTASYPYRGSSSSHGHFSGGTHHAYEYDSRQAVPSPTPTYHVDRFGHHGYHPSSSGFPDPITESSNARYSSSSYDIYNFNSLKNDVNNHYAYNRVEDPMGKYDNCRSVGGIVVCADNTNRYPPQYRDQVHHVHHPETTPAYNFPLRGEVTTMSYSYGGGGYHDRNRDRYSTYYPNQYASSSRPILNDYNNYHHRLGYPQHGPREPIDSSYSSGRHPYLPKEQHISSQSVFTISSSTTTAKNDNDHPLCKSMCGYNSICRLHLDRPVCGCAEGHTGDPSVRCIPENEGNSGNAGRVARRDGECERHVDCEASEICAKSKCIDPCSDPEGFSSSSVVIQGSQSGDNSICGANASCVVIMRTPVCKCDTGFSGNPYVACIK